MVFMLHELHGLSQWEVAEVVDTSVLVVRARLFWARRELATKLKQEPCLVEFATTGV